MIHSSNVKIQKRTLYPPIMAQLKKAGFKTVQNVAGKGFEPDIFADYDDFSSIIEIKIGNLSNLIDATSQVYNYQIQMKRKNSVVILYPDDVRKPFVSEEQVETLTTKTKIKSLLFTEFGSQRFEGYLQDLIEELLKLIKTKPEISDIHLAIDIIKQSVETISEILKNYAEVGLKDAIDLVTGRFDLFMALGETNKENIKPAIIDLISYLLVNQILFYHIYGAKTKNVPILDDNIKSISELLEYFQYIRKIDYTAIYSIDVASKLPEDKRILDNIQKIIRTIKILKPENVQHDLLGRLFHQLLPYNTRKVLATFYTNPIASEILAGLTIDKWDENIMDLACGSGTLLVGTYNRKLQLYKEHNKHFTQHDLEKVHKQFVENEITGIDIMPFASHLTAINLTSKNIKTTTNILRVGVRDSIEIQENTEMQPFGREIQLALQGLKYSQKFLSEYSRKLKPKKGSINLEGKGETFIIKKADSIVINPPFTDRDKMPLDYRNKLLGKTEDKILNSRVKKLMEKCGGQVNLWGYFVALADELLFDKGKIGVVIPINVFRGGATQKIRDYILDNYTIRYIMKSTKDVAFSESTDFRDVLLIMEKRKSKPDDTTAIIYLNRHLHELTLDDADKLVKKIKTIKNDFEDEELSVFWISHNKLIENRKNLMPIIGSVELGYRREMEEFFSAVKEKSKDKLEKLNPDKIFPAFTYRPEGLTELVFVTRTDLDISRARKSFLLLVNDNKDYITAKIKGEMPQKIKIAKTKVLPAFRTITGINSMELKKFDYVIADKYDDFRFVSSFSKWKGKDVDWKFFRNRVEKEMGCLVIPRRIRLDSNNTRMLSIVSNKPFVPGTLLWIIKTENEDDRKILCLYFNSILTLIQFLKYKSETTEQFFEMMKTDWSLVDVLNVKAIDKKKLLKLFNKIKNVEFPSLIEQLNKGFPERKELDRAILKTLGLNDGEISYWLPKIYNAVVQELKSMRRIE